MKQTLAGLLAFALLTCTLSARAIEPLAPENMEDTHTFTVEVLQVTDIEPYQQALNGFLDTLKNNGLVEGKNLSVHRVKIDFDIEKGGFWSRIGVLLRIHQEAGRIAAVKPDMVLTIGTPATKFARGIFEDAHIPLVFTAVANPEDVGSISLDDAGAGATGSTLYTDMTDTLRVVRRLFPQVHRIGMVHTDDENGVANVEAARANGGTLDFAVTSRLVGKNDSIVPSLKELYAQGSGVQMFAVPLDTYYGLHGYEPARDLANFSAENKVPVVSLALVRVPGAALYVGADFTLVGSLAGRQAVKILKRHVRPDLLPVLRQEAPTVLVDPQRMSSLGVPLPASALAHKQAVQNGFWQLDWEK